MSSQWAISLAKTMPSSESEAWRISAKAPSSKSERNRRSWVRSWREERRHPDDRRRRSGQAAAVSGPTANGTMTPTDDEEQTTSVIRSPPWRRPSRRSRARSRLNALTPPPPDRRRAQASRGRAGFRCRCRDGWRSPPARRYRDGRASSTRDPVGCRRCRAPRWAHRAARAAGARQKPCQSQTPGLPGREHAGIEIVQPAQPRRGEGRGDSPRSPP